MGGPEPARIRSWLTVPTAREATVSTCDIAESVWSSREEASDRRAEEEGFPRRTTAFSRWTGFGGLRCRRAQYGVPRYHGSVNNAVSWGEIVPLLAVLAVLQVGIGSASKLIALSNLYRIERFGHYSEAAAVAAYFITTIAIVSAWWSGENQHVPVEARRESTISAILGYLLIYAAILAVLVMFILPERWFRMSAGKVWFTFLSACTVALVALNAWPRSTWTNVLAAVTGITLIAYGISWLARHPMYRLKRNPTGAHIIRRVHNFLDRGKPSLRIDTFAQTVDMSQYMSWIGPIRTGSDVKV